MIKASVRNVRFNQARIRAGVSMLPGHRRKAHHKIASRVADATHLPRASGRLADSVRTKHSADSAQVLITDSDVEKKYAVYYGNHGRGRHMGMHRAFYKNQKKVRGYISDEISKVARFISHQ